MTLSELAAKVTGLEGQMNSLVVISGALTNEVTKTLESGENLIPMPHIAARLGHMSEEVTRTYVHESSD